MVVLDIKASNRDHFHQWILNTNILKDQLFKPFFLSMEFTSFYNINNQTMQDSSLFMGD